ncbi:Protein HMG-5 [Aphelenchoides avenae]|nr:Protein HMG-5 [Aphelenchus avenae]
MGTLLKNALLPHLRNSLRYFTTSGSLQSSGVGERSSQLPSGYRAPNKFAVFVQEQFKKTPVADRKQSKAVVVEAAKLWKSLADDAKKEYANKASQVAEQRRNEFERLPDEQKHAKLEEHAERLRKVANRHTRIARRHVSQRMWLPILTQLLLQFYARTGRPKQPLSAYKLFVQEQLQFVQTGTGTWDARKSAFRDAVSQWKSLPADAKKPYITKAAGLKEQYLRDLRKWEASCNLKAASKDFAAGKVKRGSAEKSGRHRKSTKPLD